MERSRTRAIGGFETRRGVRPCVAHVIDSNALARRPLRAAHGVRHAVPTHICLGAIEEARNIGGEGET